MKEGRRLRLGMVGGGLGAFIGNVHRIAARLDDRFELVAGALASEPGRAQESGRQLRLDPARIYDTYEDMARAEAGRPDRIDIVSIVTPNHLHHPVARRFLEADFHVLCDKPLATNLNDALDLVRTAESRKRIFVVTYTYSGYPMVRQAREMASAGEIGEIRIVQVEYPQAWLAEKREDKGFKQAVWRMDPGQSGPGGCVADIGTHAFHLCGFVTGLRVTEVAAELSTLLPGRRLDDNVHALLRFENGARGMLWASQVAAGEDNGLRLRVYGSAGSLKWSQEDPNYLIFTRRGEVPRRLARSGPGTTPAAARASRLPPGHPEGYLEAFAQLYSDTADLIQAADAGSDPPPNSPLLPGVRDGARGVEFIEAAIRSSHAGGAWTGLKL